MSKTELPSIKNYGNIDCQAQLGGAHDVCSNDLKMHSVDENIVDVKKLFMKVST